MNGQRFQTQGLVLCSLPGTGLFGTAIAKSLGNKPRKNRVKRRIKAIARKSALELIEMDVVVSAKAEVEQWDHKMLKKNLEMLIQQAKNHWEEQLGSSS